LIPKKILIQEQALKTVLKVFKKMQNDNELFEELKNTLKNSFEAKKEFNSSSIDMLRKQHDHIHILIP